MHIVLKDGAVLPYNMLVSAVLRSDSVPIPLSMEFQVLLNTEIEPQLKEGELVLIGENYIEMKIIKANIQRTGIVRDGKRVVIGAFIAILNGCEQLIRPLDKAIAIENTSIGAALKASGTKLSIAEDVPLMRYFCPFGQTPTYEIARKCAEEAAVINSDNNGKIIVRRLSTLMQNVEPKIKLDATAVSWKNNSTGLLHEVPNYITINKDGTTVEGEISAGKIASYYPNLDSRRLKNLSTALVCKGTIQRGLSTDLMAGDVIEVDSTLYYILTAAHRVDTGALGGAKVTATKLWIAQVEKL